MDAFVAVESGHAVRAGAEGRENEASLKAEHRAVVRLVIVSEEVKKAVGEEDRGGFTMRVTQVRENRAYFNERVVSVPWNNKQLALKWEHFTSKLEPGKKETWTAVVTAIVPLSSIA